MIAAISSITTFFVSLVITRHKMESVFIVETARVESELIKFVDKNIPPDTENTKGMICVYINERMRTLREFNKYDGIYTKEKRLKITKADSKILML